MTDEELEQMEAAGAFLTPGIPLRNGVSMSNAELSVAIDATFGMIRKLAPNDPPYAVALEHYKALLHVQALRARVVTCEP